MTNPKKRRCKRASSLKMKALYYARRDFRVFPAQEGGKEPLISKWPEKASTSRPTIERWWNKWPNANIAVVTGDKFIVIDIDGHEGMRTWERLCRRHGKVPQTVRVVTPGGGEHLFFAVRNTSIIRNSAGKLGRGIDVRAHHGYVIVPPSVHSNGKAYRYKNARRPDQIEVAPCPRWLRNLLVEDQKTISRGDANEQGPPIPEGQRNATLTSIAGALRRAGAIREAIVVQLRSENQTRCKPPLAEKEVEIIARSVMRYSPAVPTGTLWPAQVAEEAFHGLAGDVVRAIEPHSEADPAALLVQFLVLFGNCVGSTPGLRVEADDHGANEFVVLVGETSKGRKGTAFSQVRELFHPVDELWVKKRVLNGLVSGEGVVWQVRDSVARPSEDGGSVTVEGVDDKRLLVFEPEFASVLKVGSRETNTLSPIIRAAWDSGDLHTLAKNKTAHATGAHISIIGHITAEELRRHLSNTEMMNGFANRILWVCVRRYQLLPFGSAPHQEVAKRLSARIRGRVKKARTIGHLERSTAANQLWEVAYRGELAVDHGGLLGAATARAEAHVVRLSVIYALLDGSIVIKTSHLRAALAVWSYCRDSAEYIFGSASGDPIADRILAALRQRHEGMTRTDIRDLFQNNQSRRRIDQALELLKARNLAVMQMDTTAKIGRRPERWFGL